MKEPQETTGVLCWPKRLLCADDLRRHLTSQRELLLLPRTVITPLAADELRAKGIRIRWEMAAAGSERKPNTWYYAQEKHDALVVAAVKTLERDGMVLAKLEHADARRIAETIVTSQAGGIVFCGDAATVCCIANKINGVRAAVVIDIGQTARAKKTLGPNLFAIEMPGRTFFELRQLLRTIAASKPACANGVEGILRELDGHAHR